MKFEPLSEPEGVPYGEYGRLSIAFAKGCWANSPAAELNRAVSSSRKEMVIFMLPVRVSDD